jgi:signal peptidase II
MEEVIKRLFKIVILGFAWIVCDQFTKFYLLAHMPKREALSYLQGHLLILPTYNKGAFLSIGQHLAPALQQNIFIYGVLIVLLAIFIYALSAPFLFHADITALAFILGGALSNLADRWMYQGKVLDFIYIRFGELHTAVFNLADLGILLGAILFFVNRCKK